MAKNTKKTGAHAEMAAIESACKAMEGPGKTQRYMLIPAEEMAEMGYPNTVVCVTDGRMLTVAPKNWIAQSGKHGKLALVPTEKGQMHYIQEGETSQRETCRITDGTILPVPVYEELRKAYNGEEAAGLSRVVISRTMHIGESTNGKPVDKRLVVKPETGEPVCLLDNRYANHFDNQQFAAFVRTKNANEAGRTPVYIVGDFSVSIIMPLAPEMERSAPNKITPAHIGLPQWHTGESVKAMLASQTKTGQIPAGRAIPIDEAEVQAFETGLEESPVDSQAARIADLESENTRLTRQNAQHCQNMAGAEKRIAELEAKVQSLLKQMGESVAREALRSASGGHPASEPVAIAQNAPVKPDLPQKRSKALAEYLDRLLCPHKRKYAIALAAWFESGRKGEAPAWDKAIQETAREVYRKVQSYGGF